MTDDPLPEPKQLPAESSRLNRMWIDTIKAISTAPEAAQEWVTNGFSFLQSTVGTLRLFSSTRVDANLENPAQDETHYFLIPLPNGQYALAERRCLPPGIGTVNSLPKVRIFHVHDPAGVAVLEDQLLGRIAKERLQAPGLDADIAKRLEAIGEEIDQQSMWVTGGLVMVGTAVAIANPLLGIGIAAKALLPDLGSKLTKMGLGAAADSVRRMGSSWRERSARKEATQEIRRLKPRVAIDPVLSFVDAQTALGTRADPTFHELEQLPEWWRNREQRLTMSVVIEVLKTDGRWPDWLMSVRARLADLDQ